MKKYFLPGMVYFALPLTWSSTFIGTKVCLEYFPPLWLGAWRYILAVALYAAIVAIRGETGQFKREMRAAGNWAAAAGAGVFFAILFQNVGLTRTSASSAAIITVMEPVFLILLCAGMLGEKITRMIASGVAVAFAGAFLVVADFNSPARVSSGGAAGNMLVLISVVSYAFYAVYSKRALRRANALNTVVGSSAVAMAGLAAAAFLLEQPPAYSAVPPEGWAMLLYLAVVPTCLAFLLFNWVLQRAEASRMGVVLYLIPLYGVMLGSIFLRERLVPATLAGGAVTVLGVYIMESGIRRKKLETGPAEAAQAGETALKEEKS